MSDTTRALAVYRMERARETLKEARLLLQAGHLNAYVNRAILRLFLRRVGLAGDPRDLDEQARSFTLPAAS